MDQNSNFISLVRAILIMIGGYLIGKHIGAQTVDNALWDTISGAVLSVSVAVWGIVKKASTIEMIESGVRGIISLVGGYFVASGKITNNLVLQILGLSTTIATFIQSALSKAKTQSIKTGTVNLDKLVTGKKAA